MADSADVEKGVGVGPTPAAGMANGYPAVPMAPQGEHPVMVSCPGHALVEGQESDLTGAGDLAASRSSLLHYSAAG